MAIGSKSLRTRLGSRSRLLRRLSQAGFALFIMVSSLRHHLDSTQHLASIDAYCPFGGFATLWRWASSGGAYVQKTHQSNLVLALGLVVGVLLAGGAFCGWICPFGTLNDLLAWLRRKARVPEVHVPDRLDRILRFGRYVVLAGILYATISMVRLWFADYDPYRMIFGLGWLFEFSWGEQWPAILVSVGVLIGGFLVPRFWCRYLCPLGGIVSFLGNFSLLRIRRREASCKGCAACNSPCPVGIDVAAADPVVSSNCIGCLECVEACPRAGTLEVTLGPATPRELVHRGSESGS
jgi:NAD-dependent dihydropyrimidine dehydrogenase PreA subunit